MDLVVGLPHAQRQNDSICVIVDRLTISDNFIPVKAIFLMEEYAKLYLNEIMTMHRISLFIILDR